MVSPLIFPSIATEAEQQAFDEARSVYYAQVQWALDISTAEFRDLDLRGVPTHLVRLDPETQAVVTRDSIAAGSWTRLKLKHPVWKVIFNRMLAFGDPDAIVSAPKLSSDFETLMKDLKLLHRAGVTTVPGRDKGSLRK
jgi:hypothetical protein